MSQKLKIVYQSNFNGVMVVNPNTNKEVMNDKIRSLVDLIGSHALPECDDEEGGLFVGNMMALKDFSLSTAKEIFPDKDFTFEEDNASS